MIGTISPMVDGERVRGHWPMSHWLHIAGTVAGGAAVGFVLGLVGGQIPRLVSVIAATAVVFAYSLHELRIITVPMPERSAQVPVGWRSTYPVRAVALAYGLLLGAGALTHVTVATTYAVWFVELSVGSAAAGAAIGATYGLARGLPPAVIVIMGFRGWLAYDRFVRCHDRRIHAANGIGLAFAAGVLATIVSIGP